MEVLLLFDMILGPTLVRSLHNYVWTKEAGNAETKLDLSGLD